MSVSLLALSLLAAEPADNRWAESGNAAEASEFGSAEKKTKDRRDTAFDNSGYLYLAPIFLHAPVGGEDNIEDIYDPGYQWGFGGGYFARSQGPFGFGVGFFFDHSILNFDDDFGVDEHQLRVGAELRPGFVVAERAFIYVPLRGGYAVDLLKFDDEFGDEEFENHGGMFGVGIGADVAVWRGLYLGAAIGGDLQFFRSEEDIDFFNIAFRGFFGYLF